jgi:prepilin-type N-terminal cleavage/methylation domain-containing protein
MIHQEDNVRIAIAHRAALPRGARERPRIRMRRAFTLIETILALTIFAMISLSVCILIVAAMNTDRVLRSTNTAQSEMEFAIGRISNNIRECQTGSLTVGTSTLSTLTQADVANGYSSGATVSYSLQADPNAAGQNMLMENDQRYGNNALVHNVKTFSVAAVSGVDGLYQIDLVVGSQMTEERHIKVFTRN